MSSHPEFVLTAQQLADPITTGTKARFVAPFDMEILGARANLGTADDAAVKIDVHVDGTTVWANQSSPDDRLTIAANATASAYTRPGDSTVTAQGTAGYDPLTDGEGGAGYVAAGGIIEVIVDAGTTPGANLTVSLHCRKR